jgi:hypothetical protein
MNIFTADCSSASRRGLVAASAVVWLTAGVAGAAWSWQSGTKSGMAGQVSADTENAIVPQGVALLQKPFTPSALARKVCEMLDKSD